MESLILIPLFVQRRGSSVARDEMQRERGLIVGIEIRPVHRHDDVAPRSNDFGTHDPNNSQGATPALLQQPVDLLDRRLRDQSARRRQRLSDQANRESRPRHHSNVAIRQRQNAFGVQVVNKPNN